VSEGLPASRWTVAAATAAVATEPVAVCPTEASTGKKGGGVQRPAGSGYVSQDGNRFHDGIRNNVGGSGQEARPIRRRSRQGRL
jgi:hypothetical protein